MRARWTSSKHAPDFPHPKRLRRGEISTVVLDGAVGYIVAFARRVALGSLSIHLSTRSIWYPLGQVRQLLDSAQERNVPCERPKICLAHSERRFPGLRETRALPESRSRNVSSRTSADRLKLVSRMWKCAIRPFPRSETLPLDRW